MTSFYNKDQVDQIGALISKRLSDSDKDLKLFVENSLSSLKETIPNKVTTTLDNGREIKQKLIQGQISYQETDLFGHALNADDILDISFSISGMLGYKYVPPGYTSTTNGNVFYEIHSDSQYIKVTNKGSEVNGASFKCLITYMVPVEQSSGTPL